MYWNLGGEMSKGELLTPQRPSLGFSDMNFGFGKKNPDELAQYAVTYLNLKYLA